ncbi:OsmC family protein [Streptomyces sp. MUM 178J]|uniref:OsmC family protein n=1 Tax=Streptomyces sp. MUM 178J TaxID=2791991 RepID=UPI001F0471EE|nr:OsmC family protein [Streptomyces sp. MUM 178J]WRQ78150.1 OsmC family protein [Streptomyces sp. MUM 178J]
MAQGDQTGSGSRVHTRCGRTISVSRFGHEPLPPGMGRVVLDTAWEPYDHGEVWASLTPEEARRIAGLLLFHAAAVEPPAPGPPGRAEAVPICGDAYEVSVRGHVVTVDQPLADGGADTAPSPVELFAASVASCAAHYAGRFLDRHGISRDGLRVRADYTMAADRPARVASIAVRVDAPHLPASRVRALEAVAGRCTVTNTLETRPEVTFAVYGEQQDDAPAQHGGAAARPQSREHA